MSRTSWASNADLLRLRDRIEDRTGIHYDESQLDLLEHRLWTRVGEVQLFSLLDYDYYLRYDDSREIEWEHLISAITVNESYFWREHQAIEFVVAELVPRLGERSRPVRVWHAGCSRGEEPYTLVIAALERGLKIGEDIEVYASDIDEEVLQAAASGSYPPWALRRLPDSISSRYFQSDGARFQLSDSVRDQVKFMKSNLLEAASLLGHETMDVIFCRHVFIYFSERSLLRAVEQLHRILTPEGQLFLGASESLLRFATPFVFREVQGNLSYAKKT